MPLPFTISLETDLEYRHRRESNRLVMFHNYLKTPDQDLAAMDRHVARLEELLGGSGPAKVYWVRGRLPRIGVEMLSVHGLALGSDTSPDVQDASKIDREYRGDRHELAHAVLDQFRVPESDPPCLLHEGWAMAQCGDSSAELAREAANERRNNPGLGVRELLGPAWYRRDWGAVYSIGGAFVDFVIRTRGVARFRRFYLECTPQTIDAKCEEIFGIDLDLLEAEFWEDVRSLTGGSLLVGPGRPPRCVVCRAFASRRAFIRMSVPSRLRSPIARSPRMFLVRSERHHAELPICRWDSSRAPGRARPGSAGAATGNGPER